MATINVSTVQGLVSALGSAKSGDTIALAPGKYSDINLFNVNIAGGVTITSADANNQAEIGRMFINQCSGLTFTKLEFDSTGLDHYNLVEVGGSSYITFDNVWFHGSLNGYTGDDEGAVGIMGGSHNSVINSRFEQFQYGIAFGATDYFTASNNTLHDIGNVAIRGSGSSYVKILNNMISDIFMHVKPEYHGDAIQFFTQGTTQSAHDIEVIGNTYIRGSGDAVQGIFFRDEVGNLPYYNVTIADNTLVGAGYTGIGLGQANNSTVRDNEVYAYTDQQSWIMTSQVSNSSVTNNIATQYVWDRNGAIVQSGNTTVTALTVGALPTSLTAPTPTPAPVVTSPTPTAPSAPSAPSAPVVSLDPSTDTGTTGDLRTSMPKVKLVAVPDAGSTVTFYANGSVVGSGTTDPTGTVSLQLNTGLNEGLNKITAVAEKGGVLSATSSALDVIIDTRPAMVTVDDFSISGGKRTNLTLNGSVSDDAQIPVALKIFQDGTLVQNMSVDGAWTAARSNITNQVHTFGFETIDAAGNVGKGRTLVIGTSAGERVVGTAGNDTIYGGGGNDVLSGGGGDDIFVWKQGSEATRQKFLTSAESVTDFGPGDKLDLSDLGVLAYGGDSRTLGAREVDWYFSGGNTIVVADVNGDARADLTIQLVGQHALTASDFILA